MENEDFYNCAECKTRVNFHQEPSTQCSKCKENFCLALKKTCFSDYHRKNECKGQALSILNPKWVINLRVKE